MYKDKKFQKLKRQWYNLLAETKDANGDYFEDIEKENGELKTPAERSKVSNPTQDVLYRSLSPALQRQQSFTKQAAIAAYYNMAEWFLTNHIFASTFDYLVAKYNAKGLSRRKISVMLTGAGFKASRMSIQRTVERLDKVMYKKWAKFQGTEAE